jgi:hypothetical protein
MATESKASKDAKIIDVAQPGKTAPAGTSRPIIVGHKMLQQDPMISEDKAVATPEPEKAEDKAPAATSHNKVIVPLNETKPEVKAADAKAKSEEPKPEESPKPEEPKDDEPNSAETDGSAVVDAVAEQATAKKKQDQETEADKKRQAELEKLVEEKKYFVPIGQVRHRRNTRWGIALLFLLIIVVGAYLALDAGVVQANIKLPIDLIKN